MDCNIRVAKTKTLISFAVNAKLIWVFVFAYAKSKFSHNEAQLYTYTRYTSLIWDQNSLARRELLISEK